MTVPREFTLNPEEIKRAIRRYGETTTVSEYVQRTHGFAYDPATGLTPEAAEAMIEDGMGIISCLACGRIDVASQVGIDGRRRAVAATMLREALGAPAACVTCGATGILAPDEDGRAFVIAALPSEEDAA